MYASVPPVSSSTPKLALNVDFFLEYPFLQGRAFVFASKFAKFLQTELAGQYINATLLALESAESGAPVKISAVRALRKWVVFLFLKSFLSLTTAF